MLRKAKVVGKFVEFFGEGAASLPLPDRATIANMAPEYGATMGFFPVDDSTIDYLEGTGRRTTRSPLVEAYFKAQGMFGMPKAARSTTREVRRARPRRRSTPSVAGPKRPQDRIDLPSVKSKFTELFVASRSPTSGYGKRADDLDKRAPDRTTASTSDNGDVLIAAITSCTNTSNPGVLLAAGLLAKKAVEHGLKLQAAREDLARAGLARRSPSTSRRPGLLPYLEQLGFYVGGYGCTTCIGNSGPLDAADRGGRHQERPRRAPRCSRATATSRRASTRRSARTS